MVVCRRAVKQRRDDLELSAQIPGEAPEHFAAGGPAAGGPAAGGPVFFPRRHPSALAEQLLADLSGSGGADSSLIL